MRILRLLTTALLLAVLAAGCFHDDGAPRIGVVLPLSGPNAVYGRQILDGIEFARRTLEQSRLPDDPPPPELVVIDDAGSGAKALEAIRRLSDEGVAAALVGYASDEVLAVRNEAAKRRLPVMTPAGSNDVITLNNPYLFRANFSDGFQAKALARYAYVDAHCRRMAVLLNLDEFAVYARDLGRQAIQSFVDMGGVSCGSAGFRESDTDFHAAVRELLQNEPDVILVPAYPACAGKIVATIRECGFRGLILGSDSWFGDAFLRNCGMNAAPAAFTSAIPADLSGNMADFAKRIMAAGYGIPTVNTVLGYDAMMLTELAVRPSSDADDILARYRQMSAMTGACDTLQLKPDGDMIRPVYINEIRQAPGAMPEFRLRRVIAPSTLDRVRHPEEGRMTLPWNM